MASSRVHRHPHDDTEYDPYSAALWKEADYREIRDPVTKELRYRVETLYCRSLPGVLWVRRWKTLADGTEVLEVDSKISNNERSEMQQPATTATRELVESLTKLTLTKMQEAIGAGERFRMVKELKEIAKEHGKEVADLVTSGVRGKVGL